MSRKQHTRNATGPQGPSQRQLRAGELIRHALVDVFREEEIHDEALHGVSITVTEVRLSPDLKVATAYVMPLMGSVPVEDAIKQLAKHQGELRHLVSQGLNLKYAPELRFRADETFDRLDETRRLFSDEKVQRDLAHPDDDEEDMD